MKKIIIDTDCGMDDIIAISMLISAKDVVIKGIATTRGLTDPDIGKNNLNKIFYFLGKNINVFSGSKYPLEEIRLNNKFPEYDVKNSTELKFLTDLTKSTETIVKNPNKDEVNNFYYRTVSLNKRGTTILCLGPLTNLSKVINKYKGRFTNKIDKLFIMGGAVFSSGNVPPSKKAEYNFFLDPEAADFVLQSTVPVVLIPTDVTKFVPFTKYIKNKISKKNPETKSGKLIQRVILSNNNDFRFFYDPLAASVLIDSKIILESKRVDLCVNEQGQSLVMKKRYKRSNISVVTKVDKNRFYKLLFNKLK